MMTPGISQTAGARAALAHARRARSVALIAIAEGHSTPFEVILQAMTDEGRPLRRLSLHDLLHAQVGWTRTRATRLLGRLGSLLETEQDLTTKPISWLIDPRCGGRRLLAWLDIHAERTTPWPGFPFAPQPPGWGLKPVRIARTDSPACPPASVTAETQAEASTESGSTHPGTSSITAEKAPEQKVDPWAKEEERLLRGETAPPSAAAREAAAAGRQAPAPGAYDPWADPAAELRAGGRREPH